MKNRKVVLVGVAAVSVFAGVIWFAREPAGKAAPAVPDESTEPRAEAPPPPSQRGAPATRVPAIRIVPTDPRLAVLMGPADDAMVEYRGGPDGRVVQEVDNDPNSPGYRKPLREYSYAGDHVAVITVYKYLGDQVQVIRATASYKPDGTVDQYSETTEYRKPD